jgi:hypothetical protein
LIRVEEAIKEQSEIDEEKKQSELLDERGELKA